MPIFQTARFYFDFFMFYISFFPHNLNQTNRKGSVAPTTLGHTLALSCLASVPMRPHLAPAALYLWRAARDGQNGTRPCPGLRTATAESGGHQDQEPGGSPLLPAFLPGPPVGVPQGGIVPHLKLRGRVTRKPVMSTLGGASWRRCGYRGITLCGN